MTNVACKNKTYLDIHVKFPRFLPDVIEIWIIRHQVGAALMRANRRAGMTKLIEAFRDFFVISRTRLVLFVCVCELGWLLDCIPLVILHAVECGLWRYAQLN
jgi:hypothetical protein